MKIIEGGRGIRSFIAISLPENIKNQVDILSESLKNNLKSPSIKISWIRAKSIHLTLKFLGDISPPQVAPIVQKLNEIAVNIRPFSITIEGLGVFPNFSHPRILWVGIKEGTKEICHLQRSVEEKMVDLGFTLEKKEFSAHFTLGRIKSIQSRGLITRAFHAIDNQTIGTMVVNKINLMKSTLLASGAVYEQLGAVKFDKNFRNKDGE